MNQDSSTAWHQTLQDDPMLVTGDDDFTNFLQLGIDFPGFDETQTGHNGFDTPMGDLGMDQLAMDSSVEDIRGHTMQTGSTLSERGTADLIQRYSKISRGANSVINVPVNQRPQGEQQQKHGVQEAPYESRVMVPPTPRSSEMQGAAARYYHYMDSDGLAEFDPYQRQRDDRVSAKA
jgi:hypothetical protein